MATYKVLQDIEAEDKLIGPLSLRQCIYAAIAVIAGYLSFLAISKGASFLVVFFLPFIGFGLFFAWPWTTQQSTEVWALAKIRFALKPRKRIWDQNGLKDLVTITAPKVVEKRRVSDLSETEVRSRLRALAETIDTRGWAVKNVPLDMYTQSTFGEQNTDRLLSLEVMPQEVPSFTTTASEDMFDLTNNPLAQQFASKMNEASTSKHQQLMAQVDNPAPATSASDDNQQWYTSQPSLAPSPATTAAPQDVTAGNHPKIGKAKSGIPLAQSAGQEVQDDSHVDDSSHMKTILPLSQQTQQASGMPDPATTATTDASVTPAPNPAILELANNNDLNVATIAREAQRNSGASDEVVVSLH